MARRVLSDEQPDLPVPDGYIGGPPTMINSSNGAFSNNRDYLKTGERWMFGTDGDNFDTDGPKTYQG